MKNSLFEESGSPRLWFPFHGGLGDIILSCYRTRYWHALEETDERAAVMVGSVNPFATELFRWHVNRSRIVVYDLANAYEMAIDQGLPGKEITRALANFANLDWPGVFRNYAGSPPRGWKPTFFAPDYLDDSGHIVFHPFAGLKRRTLPPEKINAVLSALGRLPCRVYVTSRDFIRTSSGRSVHAPEELPHNEIPANVTVLKNLSVPATLNLIRNAKGFIGAHSSLVLAAAWEKIPSLALYPEFLSEEFVQAKGYADYAAWEHMSVLPFGEVSENTVSDWIDRTFDADSFDDSNAEQAAGDRLAEWVISKGGGVNVDWVCRPDFAGEEEHRAYRGREVRDVADLPSGRFRLWRLTFAGCSDFGDDDLKELKSVGSECRTVTHLNLLGTGVSEAGLAHLDWLGKSLRVLDPGRHIARTKAVKVIANLLPNCEIVSWFQGSKRDTQTGAR